MSGDSFPLLHIDICHTEFSSPPEIRRWRTTDWTGKSKEFVNLLFALTPRAPHGCRDVGDIQFRLRARAVLPSHRPRPVEGLGNHSAAAAHVEPHSQHRTPVGHGLHGVDNTPQQTQLVHASIMRALLNKVY